MMRAILLALAAGAALTLIGACASTSRAADDDARADAGERLYRSHCAACHRLRDPKEHTADRWAWAVERYGPRARLSIGQRQAVLEYLTKHAKDASPSEGTRKGSE